jgi:hypothetical protein
MSRVQGIDLLECPRCHSIRKILESIKMSTAPSSIYRPEEYQVFYEEAAIPHEEWEQQ